MASGFKTAPCEDSLRFARWEGPAILLVDLDAFFASVEQRDHPGWRGKPVIVGGSADRHGVVSTCSYEARRFGVRSAMPASQARSLCPDAIWTPGDHRRYKAVSDEIMAILRDETPRMQQVSIDEAFLDVTNTRVNTEHPVAVASRIQRRVREEQGVTCSVGVGTSKTVAKIASDVDKPHGLTVVPPGREREFLDPLPIRAMSGIGSASEDRLRKFGVKTLRDLANAEETLLREVFGKNADKMRRRALGLDLSPVEKDDAVKSVSSETTFAECLVERVDVEAAVSAMASKVGRRLRKKGLVGSTAVLKVRFGSRAVKSIQRPLAVATDDDLVFGPVLCEALGEIWREGDPVRLVGVGLTHICPKEEAQAAPRQDSLFDLIASGGANAPTGASASAPSRDGLEGSQPAQPDGSSELDSFSSAEKRETLLAAADAIRDRFGNDSLSFGFELRNAGNTTGTIPK